MHVSIESPRSRGLRFLLMGLLGGTALTAICCLVLDDWSYLKSWGGVVALVAVVPAYLTWEKWLWSQLFGAFLHMPVDRSQSDKPDASAWK